jgi:hypothetical protein
MKKTKTRDKHTDEMKAADRAKHWRRRDNEKNQRARSHKYARQQPKIDSGH